jgi:hypothetical protein
MNSQQRYQDYLQTEYWQQVSGAVKAQAGYRCQVCNSPHDLQAHHRSYANRGNELKHLDDMTCLCRRCHGIFHGKIETPRSEFVQPKQSRKERRREAAEKLAIEVHAVATKDVENEMPDGEAITLTKELINRCRCNGSFTRATTEAFGLKYPLISGWAARLAGTVVTREKYRQALRGREIYATTLRRLKKAA